MAFEGFDTQMIDVGDAAIHVRCGGRGAPLLLLHGYPQTHLCWHRVAPLLADSHRLVIPDLRGYGRSRGPSPDANGDAYAKRAMAADMAALMTKLGHDRFDVAGHDRGGRVAYRLALDSAARVRRLAVLDIVPTLEMWRRIDHAKALKSFHWAFLAQPAPMPEAMIGRDPDFWLQHLIDRWAGDASSIAAEAMDDYRRCFRDPRVIAATCADYRAGAGIDVAHDQEDLDAGRRIACPMRVVWATRYLAARSPLATWRAWADQVDEVEIDCGHFIAEERPQQCATALHEFFLAES